MLQKISKFFQINHAALTTFFIFLILVFTAQAGFCSEIKIHDLKFDNSDNVILVNSTGQITLPAPASNEENNQNGTLTGVNEIKKGFLEEPKRAFVDISSATLTGPAKTYELKNSIFNTVKISQFSLNPNVVRIVFTYKNNEAKTGDFTPIANNKGIVIRYTKELNKTVKNQIVYSNTPDKERQLFFENMTSALANITTTTAGAKNEAENYGKINQKEYQLQSKFFVNGTAQTKNGIMIKGTGFLSIKPTILLQGPDRLVIDLDDSVLAKNLRNKAITIGNTAYNDNGTLKQREILKMGQNSTNVVRLVIQGNEAKNYRAVVSPDLQNLYIAKRTDVINSNITETKSVVKTISSLTAEEGSTTLEFTFSNPVTFSVFEEGENLYLDLNNVQELPDVCFNELIKAYPTAQTIKIALDKTRIVFPIKDKDSSIQVKVSPDSKIIQAIIKARPKETPKEQPKEEKPSIIQKITKKEGPSISNLYKVVIDAGHGGTDVGATRVGIYEKNITLAIAKMVEKNLQAKGVKTTMTLDKDKTVSLQERCDISNGVAPNLFVSIHVNSSVNDEIIGVETHWWKEDSFEYAKKVHSHLQKNISKWQTKDRGLFKSKFYVINHTEAPAILVEIGFISNAVEREAIITQKRQEEIAKSISDGVLEFLKTGTEAQKK